MLRVSALALYDLLRLALAPLWWLSRFARRPKGRWVLVRLRPRVAELPRPLPPWVRFFPRALRALPTPMSLLRTLADRALEDRRIEGVAIVVPPLQVGWAMARALRQVLARLREGGKQVVVFLPRGGGHHELYLASAADRVLISPEASLATLGLSVETHYLKPLLDRAGVEVQRFARAEFKTAMENLALERMSEPQRQQLEALLGTVDGELRGALRARPGMDEARVAALFEGALHRGEEAVRAGIADGVCYEDELPARVVAEGSAPAKWVRAPRYLAYREERLLLPLRPRPYVAVVEVRGLIAERGERGGGMEGVVAALRQARSDRRALGVILRVSSPGGSALASDLIHREVVRLKEKKPVVACFADVAASGGYYVAAPAHLIVAEPTTVTGSIGVVSGRLLARELLDKLGVRTEVIRTAPHADLFSPARALEPAEVDIVEREMDAFYRGFVSLVAGARGKTYDDIEPLCRGRVWSGADAHARGLVDRLGGFDVALEEVRARVGLAPREAAKLEPRVVTAERPDLPPPEPPGGPARETLARLLPGAEELVGILARGERVLYYAPGLPVVR